MSYSFSSYLRVGLLSLCASVATHAVAQTQSAADFFHNRTLTLVVPTSPGGINDISGRLVARHMGRFMVGQPNIVVQNVPGGGGLVAANKLANTFEHDGSTFAILERATALIPFQHDPNAKFDPLALTWLGSLSDFSTDAYLVVINANSPIKSPQDLRNGTLTLRLGGNQPGSTNLSFALIAKNVLGLNIDVVRGYPGAAPMFMAMERGELDGQVIGYNSIRAGQPTLWANKQVRPLIQFARSTRLPQLPDVPTGRELTSDPKMLALLEFAETPFFMALPFVAPPHLPPDRAKVMRDAFMAMVKDKEFLSDAEKVNLDISPIDGDAIVAILQKASKTPRDVIDLYTKLASPEKD
jgi:tripartite-type tricarboxylate transporter receptor subunit TctC